MEKKYEEYLLREFSKKGLADRDKIKYILDFKEKYGLNWKEIAEMTGYSQATLKNNLKLLKIPEEYYTELKEIGLTNKQMTAMFNPVETNTEKILGKVLNKLHGIKKVKLTSENTIKLIQIEINRLKDIIERQKVNK